MNLQNGDKKEQEIITQIDGILAEYKSKVQFVRQSLRRHAVFNVRKKQGK